MRSISAARRAERGALQVQTGQIEQPRGDVVVLELGRQAGDVVGQRADRLIA